MKTVRVGSPTLAMKGNDSLAKRRLQGREGKASMVGRKFRVSHWGKLPCESGSEILNDHAR
jgi:hypothetical protein